MFDLHQAVAQANPLLVEALIALPGAINRKWAHGWTPLHFAAAGYARHAQGLSEKSRTLAQVYDRICARLLEEGADPTLCDEQTRSPVVVADGATPPSLRAWFARKAEAGEFDDELTGALLSCVVTRAQVERRQGRAQWGLGQINARTTVARRDWRVDWRPEPRA